MILSVDILNGGRELGFPPTPGSIVEIFWVGLLGPETPEKGEERHRRLQLEQERLRTLVRDLVGAFRVRFVFGGYSAFVSRYVAWLEQAELKAATSMPSPEDLLWPLTYLSECNLDDAELKALPAYHTERIGSGALVQVFEDLVNGHEDKYKATAHALGLRSVWELSS
jgi:hypothetical protein